jgi:hypothetical protein
MQIDKMLHILSEEEEEDVIPNANWQNVAHFFRGGRGHYRMQIDKMLHIFSEEEEEDIIPNANWQNVCMCKQEQLFRLEWERERVRNLVPHDSCCKYIWFIRIAWESMARYFSNLIWSFCVWTDQ